MRSVCQLLGSQVEIKAITTMYDHLTLDFTSFNGLHITKEPADIRNGGPWPLIVLKIGFSLLNECCHAFLTVFLKSRNPNNDVKS